ncbi:MAG: MFS transporter [Heyndrickxia sp.]
MSIKFFLKNKNLTAYYGTLIFTALADTMFLLTITWIGANIGGSYLSFILGCWTVPRFVFLILGGILVDRVNVFSILRNLLIVKSILIFIYLILSLYFGSFYLLPIFTIFSSIVDSFRSPAVPTIIPSLVSKDELAKANKYRSLFIQSFSLIGPVIGGGIIAKTSTSVSLLLVGILYLLGSILFIFIKYKSKERKSIYQKGMLSQIKTGYMVVLSQPVIKIFLPIIFSSNMFMAMANDVALPLFVNNSLKGNALQFGIFSSCFVAGLMVGTLFSEKILQKMREYRTSLLLVILSDFSFLWLAVINHSYLSLFFIFVSGLLLGPVGPIYITKMQELISEEHYGKSMALVQYMSKISGPIGIALGGMLISLVSPAQVIIYSCLGSVIIGIIIYIYSRSIKDVSNIKSDLNTQDGKNL